MQDSAITSLPLREHALKIKENAQDHWNAFLVRYGNYVSKVACNGPGHDISMQLPVDLATLFDIEGLRTDEMVIPNPPGIGVANPAFRPTIKLLELKEGVLKARAADCMDFKCWLRKHARQSA